MILGPPPPLSITHPALAAGETTVASHWTDLNPSNSNGCEIGLSRRVERAGARTDAALSSSFVGAERRPTLTDPRDKQVASRTRVSEREETEALAHYGGNA